MAKDKKSKKGKQEEDFTDDKGDTETITTIKGSGDDNSATAAKATSKKGKKSRRKDDWDDDDIADELEALKSMSLEDQQVSKRKDSKSDKIENKMTKEEEMDDVVSKKSKKKGKVMDEDDDDDDEYSKINQSKKKGSKGKVSDDSHVDQIKSKVNKKKGKVEVDSDDETVEFDLPKGSKLKKQKGRKGKFDDDDASFEDVKKGSKANKKKGKGDDGTDSEMDEDVQTKKQKSKISKNEDSDEESKKSNKKKGKGKIEISDIEEVESKSRKKGKGRKGKAVSDDEDFDEPLTAKNTKGKKGSLVVSDDEEKLESKTSKKSKGKKGRVDLSDEEEEVLLSKGKQNKSQKSKKDDDDDQTFTKDKYKKKGKKGKRDDSEDEIDSSAVKQRTTDKPKSAFHLLDVEDMDIDMGDDDIEDEDKLPLASNEKQKMKIQKQESEEMIEVEEEQTKKPEKGSKKSKKKERRKKQDDEDDEVEKMLEELALEFDGKKPAEKSREKSVEADNAVPQEAEDLVGKQSKKKKKKKEVEETESMLKAEEKETSPQIGEGDREIKAKTAGQKKKEKKERQKKASQESVKKPEGQKEEDANVTKVQEDDKLKSGDEAEGDEDDGKKKKKDKKKKKGEEEKKDKKRPGKKQLAAIQEALTKLKEEEAKQKLEEEAKLKAEEEAERIRQEKLKLEQERKERKKLKEKEKMKRLKAEGKLLTKSQKQAQARIELTLQVLRQQGVEIPQAGEKKPRLGDKKWQRKKKPDEKSSETGNSTEPPKVEVEIVDPTEKEPSPVESKTEEDAEMDEEESEVKESWEDNEEDDVKDAWDESSDESDAVMVVKSKDHKVVKPVSKQIIKKAQESVEESDEEDSESESEESSEESESEESSEESEEEDKRKLEEKIREKVMLRIQKRKEDNERNRTTDKLRSPVVCVLGHVDTGKTKILDKIRRTHVQDSEAGGITQQIGATMVPQEALKEQCKMVKKFVEMELRVPGLLIIDTPGHESFSNLRSRGSSLCDIAILVVDIMHGLEPQTIESINLLKQKKTPFVVALNKIDRLYDWKPGKNKDVQEVIKSQAKNTKMEFDERTKEVILQFAEQGLNATLFYENKDPRSYISMIPTSAFSGDGMGNLMSLLVELTQALMAKRLAFTEELQATVLEVKAIPGLGTTIDVILVNGCLREGETIIVAGHDGPVVTQIRSLLMPQPLKELRVKSPYQEFKEVEGAQGVKIAGKDLDKAIAGLQLVVAHHADEVDILKEEVSRSLKEAMSSIKLAERGVYVQASTLGSLEALLEFLKASKIPYSGVRIGPVVKKDVMKASIMLEHESQYAVILAFDVKIERDAQELADSLGVKIFQADIIYHLFDKFTAYREELKQKKRDEFKNVAVFPCKLRILPQFIFNSRDPIVMGVVVEAGVIKEGTPLCVPSKEFLEIGTVTTLEVNHKTIDSARRGQEICIKIESFSGDAPKMYGRHFDHTDLLVSKISRQSIDICKEYFRDDLQKTDWQLMVELKKMFQIL